MSDIDSLSGMASCRACVRAHKMALQSQRAVWHILLSDTVDFKQLQQSMAAMTAAENVASSIYRKCVALAQGSNV